MNKSETIGNLAKALPLAQGEFRAIRFDSVNPFLKNHFASLGALIEATRAILAKHGLSVIQIPFSEGELVGVETILLHVSGEYISGTMKLPVGEERGKSNAQVAGSIITYIRRYSYASILGLYADEDGDGNKPVEAKPEPQAEPEPEPIEEPMTIERAMKITNSEGTPYGEIPGEKLQAMVLGINKGLKNGIDDAKRAEYLEKKQAIGVILKARANKEI